jgi:hypothetical protein
MALSARSQQTLATALALIGWLALLLQFYLVIRQGSSHGKTVLEGVVIYFGFFTILTNIWVSATLAIPLLIPRSAVGRFFSRPAVIAGATVSIALVGLVYHYLLRGLVDLQGLNALANALLHYVMPAGFVVYAWIVLSGATLRWIHPLLWSLYLVAYFIYVMVRGEIMGSYPYPFIDVTWLGYTKTFQHGCLMLVTFLLLGFAFVALINARNRYVRS